MFIRNYKNEDLISIKNLISNSLGYDVSLDELSIRIDNMLQSANYAILVAEDDANIVGFVGLQISLSFEDPGKILRIIALAVSSNYQGKGIGTQLIKGAEKFAEENELHVIVVNSGLKRIEAHRFYEKNMFIKKGYSFVKKI